MSSLNNRKNQPLLSEEGEPLKEGVRLQDDASKLRATNEINSVVTTYLRGEDGLQLPNELQKKEDISNAVTYGTLLEKGIDRNSDGNSNLVSQIKERVESARQLVGRVVSVCGIASLPSEILIFIFSLAIDCSSQGVPRSLHSVRLSHVCQHFRNIITATPLFWTEISATPRSPEMDLVEASLQRSGDSPLNVHLNVYIFPIQVGTLPVPQELQLMFPDGVLREFIEGINCDSTLSSLALHAHRWRNLHLNIVPVNGEINPSFGFELIQNSIFPILESVTVFRENASLRQEEGEFSVDKEYSRVMGFASSWTTPMLRTLNLRDTIPSSLRGSSLAAITSLHVNLSFITNVASLYPLFSKLEQVEEIFLDVSRLESSWDGGQVRRIKDVVISSARRVTLRFDEDAGDMQSWQAIFFKLYCPNATTLAIEATRCKKEPKSAFLYQLLPGIPDRFPKVRNYTIAVEESSTIHRLKDHQPTSLPLHFPPTLEHLTFTCNCSLWFSGEDAQNMISRVSGLRTLTLGVNPFNWYDIRPALDWVRWIADSIQSHKHLEQTFEKLEILEFRYLRGYRLMKIVPRDEIDAWCESGVVLPEW